MGLMVPGMRRHLTYRLSESGIVLHVVQGVVSGIAPCIVLRIAQSVVPCSGLYAGQRLVRRLP